MELSQKDIAEVGQAVENLGCLVEQQLALIQEKLNHLSNYASDSLTQIKTLYGRLHALESDLEELKEKAEDLNSLRQEVKGMARSLEKQLSDLQVIILKTNQAGPT
jgi:chromosome segregation ATPase